MFSKLSQLKKSLSDADSFDDCQPSLSKLGNSSKVSEALNRLLKVVMCRAPFPALVWGWRSLVSIWEKADRLPRPCS